MNARSALMTLLLGLGLTAPVVAQPHTPVTVAQAGGSFTQRVKQLDAATAAANKATTPAARAELGLARLQALQKALSAIPVGKTPDARFLAKYKNEIVANDPAGQWIVRADAFWKLRDQYATQPAAEAIAWAAGSQTLPGECETDGSCHLTWVKISYARYLELYPAGKHAKDALAAMSTRLGYLSNDKQNVFEYPAENKTETEATIAYLRKVVSAAAPATRAKVLQQLDKIAAHASKSK